MRRFGRILSYAFCLAVVAAEAMAQAPFPSKPIRIIVPYAAGGLTDVVARHYAEQLRKDLGQQGSSRTSRAPPASSRSRPWPARGPTATR